MRPDNFIFSARIRQQENLDYLNQLLVKLKCEEGNYNTRNEHFTAALIEKLMRIYDEVTSLVSSAQDATLSEQIKQYISDSLKIAKHGAWGGAIGSLCGWLGSRGNSDPALAGAAIAAVPAILFAVWEVKNEEAARNNARGFLAFFEDIKLNRVKIKQRMTAIAENLVFQFKYLINTLPSSENGTERLANFFTMVMVRDFPKYRKEILEGLLDEQQIINLAAKVAVLANSEDPLYRGFIKKYALVDVAGRKLTIAGALLRAPIYVISTQTFLVRDGKIGEENRVDKYPLRRINAGNPLRYKLADEDSLRIIYSRPPIEVQIEYIKKKLELLSILSTQKIVAHLNTGLRVKKERALPRQRWSADAAPLPLTCSSADTPDIPNSKIILETPVITSDIKVADSCHVQKRELSPLDIIQQQCLQIELQLLSSDNRKFGLFFTRH